MKYSGMIAMENTGNAINSDSSVDANMKIEKVTTCNQRNSYRLPSSTKLHMKEIPVGGAMTVVDENESLSMDPRIYAHATRGDGDVDGFIKILASISISISSSSKKEEAESVLLQHYSSIILSQISRHRRNTCLHLAASFGHHDLANYIILQCPDLIQKTNSDNDTALHIAARKRDLSFVNMVMDSCRRRPSPDVEKADKAEAELLRLINKQGNTVLHEALINHCKEEEVVEIFRKADPQLAYYPNREGKTPVYLAAEENYFRLVEVIAESDVQLQSMETVDRLATPAVYGAILAKNKVMLEKLLDRKLIHQKDKDGKTPLHYASWVGYLEGVQKLLDDQSNFDRYEMDKEGFCPIHVASSKGYVDIVKALLQFSPDSKEILSGEGENFLHVAAKFGADNIVKYVLKQKWLDNLINEKDWYGNTPLHLATMYVHPKIVYYLTWDKRVDLNLLNDEGQTALDIALSVAHPTSFHQRLIWTALEFVGAQSAREPNSMAPPSGQPKTPNTEEDRDRVNTLLLVSTLVVTVTFSAGFTMPGGYKNSSDDPNAGMATLLMKNMFHVFVICNTLALYTSILTAITLIWAQLGDLNLMYTALRFALPFLGVALTAMSFGFTAAVYLVVSDLHWLAIVVLSIGIIYLVILFVPFLLLFPPTKNTSYIIRYISYYPFLILVWASQSH